MIKTALQHFIFDFCINEIFEGIKNNFVIDDDFPEYYNDCTDDIIALLNFAFIPEEIACYIARIYKINNYSKLLRFVRLYAHGLSTPKLGRGIMKKWLEASKNIKND